MKLNLKKMYTSLTCSQDGYNKEKALLILNMCEIILPQRPQYCQIKIACIFIFQDAWHLEKQHINKYNII